MFRILRYILYYNIPSNNRELQHCLLQYSVHLYYNIPSNNRELQLSRVSVVFLCIITYQVITGNYSVQGRVGRLARIITYQVITGNYSRVAIRVVFVLIITYQVITGNYSCFEVQALFGRL